MRRLARRLFTLTAAVSLVLRGAVRDMVGAGHAIRRGIVEFKGRLKEIEDDLRGR